MVRFPGWKVSALRVGILPALLASEPTALRAGRTEGDSPEMAADLLFAAGRQAQGRKGLCSLNRPSRGSLASTGLPQALGFSAAPVASLGATGGCL